MNKIKIELGGFLSKAFSNGPDGVPVLNMLIGGEWVSSSNKQFIDVQRPIDEGIIARVPMAIIDDVNRAA